MFDFSVRKGKQYTFCTLYVCVVRSEDVCSVYVLKKQREKEMKFNAE